MKLWRRYLFKEIGKVFFFFLIAFYALYAVLDYSTHSGDFTSLPDFFSYYRDIFLKRADLLLPLALMISSIKVLTTMNVRREWMVLQVSGLKTRTLLGPFFACALFCSLFCWGNFEFFLPGALQRIDDFHANPAKHSRRGKRRELIHLLALKDNSKLIYQGYDSTKEALFDVLWIRSIDEIWRMKFLSANPLTPHAEYVDHLKRNPEGFLEKVESFPKYVFSDLKWRPGMLGKSIIPYENRSMKELFRLMKASSSTPYEAPRIKTHLFYKAADPLLSLLVLLAVLPFCTAFSRSIPLFFIYAAALFFLLAFYMLLDMAVIFGEHGVTTPALAIFTPFLLLGTIFTWRFLKKTV